MQTCTGAYIYIYIDMCSLPAGSEIAIARVILPIAPKEVPARVGVYLFRTAEAVSRGVGRSPLPLCRTPATPRHARGCRNTNSDHLLCTAEPLASRCSDRWIG